ncbi:MAG TPA: gliding motility-associated C-terminal domain-containing protein [Mucilaginibacter sp.]|nr:gliding motility-associated C-terminal domain-containing protein [Mucilaginibacter sp.]
MQFHLNSHLLQGKTILKVKRDFYDPYLWVLAKNNEVYRVNSVTLAVDNYTAQFSAYNSLPFIDIAGRSKDTVFIATATTNVIQYKNGAIRLIGSADKIPGTVTSVGIDKNLYLQQGTIAHILMIGTTNGFCQYNMDTEKPVAVLDDGNSTVYEATYRKKMYKDSSSAYGSYFNPDTIQYLPTVHGNWQGGIYIAALWEGGKTFGYNINTGYYLSANIDETGDETDYANLFWGNSKGMFQNNNNLSYSSMFSYGHYLNGINVNKITSIYGLVAFGDNGYSPDPGNTKENLLIGTDVGLYFSSSVYNEYMVNYAQDLRHFSLFHYDELGNIRVNDISVNTSSTKMPICEDGVWLACDDGLYLIKPDYGVYLNSHPLQAASFQDMDASVSQTTICTGTSVTAVLNPVLYPELTVQWFKDGQELPSKTDKSLVINTSGEYYAVLYAPCGNVHWESNHLTVQVMSGPVFSFNYPDKLQYCDETQTILQTDNNPQYTYRWYTNGVLNGATGYQYTVTQSGKYKVEVSACTNSWVPSKEIEVDLINLPVPTITADKPKYCAGDAAQLTVNTPIDPGYHINWYQDGNLIAVDPDKTSIQATLDGNYSVTLSSTVGSCTQPSVPYQVTFTPAPIFTFNYADELRYCSGTPLTLTATGSTAYQYRWYKDGNLTGDTGPSLSIIQTGKYKVEVSSCDGSWVRSKEVQVDLINLPAPVISTDKPAYCIGDNSTLSIAVPADPNYTINWYKDNVLQSAYANQTSVTTIDGGSYSVSIISNQANTDGSICTQTSSVQTIVFNPPPTASIQKIVRTTLCDGQTVDLKVSYNTRTVNWSTGQSSDQISVKQSGTYKATVTSAAGCSTEVSTDVQFFPNPILNIPNTAVCVPSHKSVTLTAPTGMSTYTWNGQQGNNTFIVDHPQTVTLTVTDANGCQATQDIQVADECPDVRIPNAFTPNGDGINDTWDIIGLEYDQTAMVRIFTRYGQQVFQSKGYGIPWNGEYQGKKLPTGAYYYIINTKNGTQTYSGEVTIIY